MVVVNRVARAVVLLALVWSLGSLLAAVNWHSNFTALQGSGDSGSEFVLHAQERWQHWVDMTLIGVVVAVLALVGALWPLVRAVGQRAERGAEDHAGSATEIDLRGRDGFGGGSEEVRRQAEKRDAV
ncbi:hypothetical protein FHN55_19180 [Streptomyces sp. NP160]|uniref:hypothetical protein n=1 Tax=Streptomyces sp. NP160 TaxID=2586637 RepID=UPI00111B4D8F|nr:hypothetical protein [Streptomyces sp. NP160]TNM59934.1 hypothetical protein FHN55_19180 [Streptomyces sp. NP160]